MISNLKETRLFTCIYLLQHLTTLANTHAAHTYTRTSEYTPIYQCKYTNAWVEVKTIYGCQLTCY